MDGMELAKKLNGRGELKMAVENLLNIIDDDEINLTNDAENKIVVAGRKLSKTALEDWAKQQSERKSIAFKKTHPNLHKDGKKNCAGTVY